jgi:hypothetical protein
LEAADDLKTILMILQEMARLRLYLEGIIEMGWALVASGHLVLEAPEIHIGPYAEDNLCTRASFHHTVDIS